MGSNEEKEISKVLQEYASSLNAAQIHRIPTFYTEDGLFMPNGLKTFTRPDLSQETAGSFLEHTDFRIEYTIESVEVNDDYAFVSAAASTSIKNASTGDINKKTSRDFFVFRKEADQWKIYRYIFNNTLNTAP